MFLFGLGVGFVVTTLGWGIVAHRFPSLFSWIVDSGASAVNKVDDTVKAKVAQK